MDSRGIAAGWLITDVLLQGYPVFTALGWGGTGTVEAVLAAWIVLKLTGGRPRGNRVRDIAALAVAAVAAPLVGALCSHSRSAIILFQSVSPSGRH
jgi:integral membrane sensor domain MASE1